ncbi:LANO_0B03576g1_1 [Lachancea nothofagi CBS 11611]|uniref:JmjC domain-containing histone demethylation protein 1 n=1 Tax=Lachancea nothofagi CBS 11611 TaxID=1266666 RepID=A0A1G4IX89_9SACH|nr:LANO_0B03576g1_1 [Lachancea nothofagi CBS 11611]
MPSDTCTFCLKDDPNKYLWVQCELCDQWVHVTCIPIKYLTSEVGDTMASYPKNSKEIKRYTCTRHGDPLLEVRQVGKKRKVENQEHADVVPKRHGLRRKKQVDYISLNEGEAKRLKNEHPHIPSFLACFARWENKSNVMKSSDVERQFETINIPLKVEDPENSGMQLPTGPDGQTLTVDAITKFLGDESRVDVMDVQSQQNSNWTMAQWNNYFTDSSPETRDRVRNVISLEVSHVDKFKKELRRPRVVESKDLVNLVWDAIPNDTERPKVTKYILMSVENAYTDFHLDFAGTSVYYKVVSGAKKFILFPPTAHNLDSYTAWCDSDHQNLIFLGDELEHGVAMELGAGDLFMIPCGYIHAVYTPKDSLIIGGNFLTLRDLETQLQIVKIEQRTKVPKKFTFPKFDAVMGKTSEWMLLHPELIDNNSKQRQLETLIAFLKDSKAKYKPVNFLSKKDLVKQLQNEVTKLKADTN